MEDCKELLLNHIHVHSGGGGGVPSASPAPCYPQLHAQSQSTHGLSLPNAQNHVLMHVQDPRADNIQCIGDGDTSVQRTNMIGAEDLSQKACNMDAEQLKPHASYSMHAPPAAMNVALHHQENVSTIGNPPISEASITAPQPSGTQHMMHTSINLPLPDPFKKKRARKFSINASSSIPLHTTAHHFGERGQMGALVQSLTPNVITIARGEDVSLRIALFQQEGNWEICVLSALGSISNVTLRHSETCSGTVTYEGCYDILALSGSVSPVSDEGFANKGGLVVSLAGLDGRVFGGEVTGLFIAATPIKVVVGTFLSEAYRSQVQGGDANKAAEAETATAFAAIPLHSTMY